MAEQRLIDANALLRDIEAYLALKPGMVGTMFEYFQLLALDCVETAPTVDAKPVVHAHWQKENDLFYVCSKCKTTLPYNFEQEYITHWQCNYCPKCGAQMDEKEG